jgi:hypothetical protein
MVALWSPVGTGNGAAITNTTISYTNSAGVAGRTGTIAGAGFPSSSAIGTFQPFLLDAGDVGVRSIQSITLGTSYVSGSLSLVMYRVLARLDTATMFGAQIDAVTGGLPRLYDNTVPFLMEIPNGLTSHVVSGQIVYTQG